MIEVNLMDRLLDLDQFIYKTPALKDEFAAFLKEMKK
jgi:hypothetical protein